MTINLRLMRSSGIAIASCSLRSHSLLSMVLMVASRTFRNPPPGVLLLKLHTLVAGTVLGLRPLDEIHHPDHLMYQGMSCVDCL